MVGDIDWAPLVLSFAAVNWTAVLTGLVSAGAAVSGPLLLWKRQTKREAATVRASLLAEVDALMEIIEIRGYLTALREQEAALIARRASANSESENDESDLEEEFFQANIDGDFNRVYQANVTKLGVLSAEEARQIVRFHQFADSVRLDVIPGGVLAVGSDNPEAFREVILLLETILEIGKDLVGKETNRSDQERRSGG
ncbi:hypothetical protein ACKJSM_05055 [Pseudomonas sp. PHC1]|uniref:hypothetical protein n=1 Tax=Pseudomonas sp. PHC1 TaxID=3384759 RepID=UPI00396F6BDF